MLDILEYRYPENDTDLDFEEIYVGLSMGDLGLAYASGVDGAPDYMEVSYGIGPVGVSLVNMMITVITLEYPMDFHVGHMIVH